MRPTLQPEVARFDALEPLSDNVPTASQSVDTDDVWAELEELNEYDDVEPSRPIRKKKSNARADKGYIDPFSQPSLEDRIRERGNAAAEEYAKSEFYIALLWPVLVLIIGWLFYMTYDPALAKDGPAIGKLAQLTKVMGRRGILLFFGALFLGSLVPIVMELLYSRSRRVAEFVDWRDSLYGAKRAGADIGLAMGISALAAILLSPIFFINVPEAPPGGRDDLVKFAKPMSEEEVQRQVAEKKAQEEQAQVAKVAAQEEQVRKRIEAEENRGGFKLRHDGTQFAFDSVSGRLAAIEYATSRMVIYDTTESDDDAFRVVAELDVLAKPLAVHFHRWNGQPHFFVGGGLAAEIQIVDGESGEVGPTVSVDGACVVEIDSGQFESDPNIYFLAIEAANRSNSAGRLGQIRLTDDGPEFRGLLTSAKLRGTDLEVSPNGQFIYERDVRVTPTGCRRWQVLDEPGEGGAQFSVRSVADEHRTTGPWIVDPNGFYVVEGKQIHQADLKKSLGQFEFSPSAIFSRTPLAVGFSGIPDPTAPTTRRVRRAGRYVSVPIPQPGPPSIQIASITTRKKAAEFKLPADWLQTDQVNDDERVFLAQQGVVLEPSRFSPIFVDESRDRLLVCNSDRVLVYELASLKLPELQTPAFLVSVPGKLAIGETLDVAVQPRHDATTVRLLDGPKGMELNDGRLQWTPAFDQVGSFDYLISGTNGEASLEFNGEIVVERPSLPIDFKVMRFAMTKDGRRGAALGVNDWPKNTYNDSEAAYDRVAVVDVQNRKLLYSGKLNRTFRNIAIDDRGIVLGRGQRVANASSFRFAVRTLDPETFKGSGKSKEFDGALLFNSPHQLALRPNGDVTYGGIVLDRDSLEIVRDERIEDRGRYAVKQHFPIERYQLDSGYYFDAGFVLNPEGRVSLVTHSHGVPSTVLAAAPNAPKMDYPPEWGRPVVGAKAQNGQVNFPGLMDTYGDGNRSGYGRWPLPVAAAVHMNRRIDEGRRQLTSLRLGDLVNGDDAREIPVASVSLSGYFRGPQRHAEIVESERCFAILDRGRVFLIDFSELDTARYQAPFRFLYDVSSNVVSVREPTDVTYTLLGGKAPYKLQTEASLTRHGRGEIGPPPSIEGLAVRFSTESIRARSVLLATQMTSMLSRQRDQFLANVRRNRDLYQRVTNSEATGIPVALHVSLSATDADDQIAYLQHLLYVDVPIVEVVRELQKSNASELGQLLTRIRFESSDAGINKSDVAETQPAMSDSSTELEADLLTSFSREFRSSIGKTPAARVTVGEVVETVRTTIAQQKQAREIETLRYGLARRRWTDKDGRQISATRVEAFGDSVLFRRRSGAELIVKIEDLSKADQEFLKDYDPNATTLAKEESEALWLKGVPQDWTRFRSQNGRMPPLAVLGKDGRPQFSWRVAALQVVPPYTEVISLARPDEPFDSEHNSLVFSAVPTTALADSKGFTRWHPVDVPSAAIRRGQMADFNEFTDKPSETVVLAEGPTDATAHWAAPFSLSVDQLALVEEPTRVLCLDGQIRLVPAKTQAIEWKKLASVKDGLKPNVELRRID